MNKRAENILQDTFVANTHDDFLCEVFYKRQQGRTNVIASDYLPRFQKAHLNLVIAAIYIEDIFVPHMATHVALDMIGALYAEERESQGAFSICTSYQQIMDAQEQGKVAIMLSLEGGEPLAGDPLLLHAFCQLGVRFLGPCWSRRNALADGNSTADNPNEKNGGFSAIGREILELCAQLGIVLDVSHISDRGFCDMIDLPGGKIIASHSNARSIFAHRRNLRDDQMRSLTAKNTLIGLNGVNTLAVEDDSALTHEILLRHADHIIEQTSEDVVCFGFDFCQDLLSFGPDTEGRRKVIDIVQGYQDVPQFVSSMLAHGYSEERVRKIAGENVLHFIKEAF